MIKRTAILTILLLGSLVAAHAESYVLNTNTDGAQFLVNFLGATGNPNQYSFQLIVDTTTYTGPGSELWALALKTSDNIDALSGTGPAGWTFAFGNANANGCGGQDNGFGCVQATANPNAGLGVGAVNGGTFTFNFLVTLHPGASLFVDPNGVPHLQARFGDDTCSTNKRTQVTTCSFNNAFGISEDLTLVKQKVPEPASMALLGTGLLGAGRFLRRRVKK